MLRFFLARLAVLIPTFLGVSIIAFSFIRLLPGDPVMLLSGEREQQTAATRQARPPERRLQPRQAVDRRQVVGVQAVLQAQHQGHAQPAQRVQTFHAYAFFVEAAVFGDNRAGPSRW